MNKVKVLHIIHALHGGGAERFAVALVKNLDRDKFEAEVVCLRDEGNWRKELNDRGIKITVLGGIRGLSFLSFFKLWRAVKNSAPAIVHTHLFWGDFFGRIAAKLAGVKIIVSTEQNLNYSEGLLKRLGKMMTARLANVIVAISLAVKNYAMQNEGAKEKQIVIIPNGLEVEKFLNNSRAYDQDNRELLIGSIGRLVRQKGFDCLIRAMAGVSGQVKCLIAGEGEKRTELQKLIDRLKLAEKAKLVGWQDDVKKFLDGLDIFVLPSRWEGLGMVILEAGLAGLPVIGSKVDGIAEIIADGEDGLLFESGNAAELAEKIKSLRDDQSERMRLGKNLQKKVAADYSIERITRQYEALYFKILGSR